MRTDDFDDIQPEDVNEPRPDKAIDVDGAEEFNEFDQPAAQSNSLGELWRNNPLIKLAVISIGVVMLVAAYLVFGGQGPETPESSVGTAVQDREAPGGPASEAYTQAINDVNEQRLNQAMRSGESTIPIPTAGNDTETTQPVLEEPPVTLEDPLADWRGAVQQPQQQDPTLERPQQPAQGQYPQQVPAQPMGPDPAAVDALAQAMSSQMSTILSKHQINGSQIMTVTAADYLENMDAANQAAIDAARDATEEEEDVEEILVPAGTIAYAQTLTESNSDVPGPVLARISSGPLTGSRILGTFRNEEEYLVLEFNRVVINGVDYPMQAIAIDPKTTLPAVASDVDHRYWRRFVLPAAASFIEGMGDAIAQREQTIVVSEGTVTSSQSDLNTTQELAAGFAEGTRSIAEDIDEEGDDVEPLVRVYAGTPIGVLFLDPVINQE